MDTLFVEYANPFPMLDGYIETGRFQEFISVFQEQRAERQKWQFYLNKIPSWSDMSWSEFKEALKEQEEQKKYHTATREQAEATIKYSKEIISNFDPTKG